MKSFNDFERRVSGGDFVNRVLLRRQQLSLTRQVAQHDKNEILQQRDVVLTVLEEYHDWLSGR